jgi:hypothetical protein
LTQSLTKLQMENPTTMHFTVNILILLLLRHN